MRGLSYQQLLEINLLIDQSTSLQSLGADVLEKEVIVKDVVLEVAKVGMESGFELIFSGGTSLSQGWEIIERISEDVDFRIISPKFPSKNSKSKALSGLKKQLGDSLRKAGFDIEGEIIGKDNNRYIRANVVYESAFGMDSASIRPHVQVELMGVDDPFTIEQRAINDISQRHGVSEKSSSPLVSMVSLPDILSDKVISYLRRTAEHRAHPEASGRYDPRLVRHLYDVHQIVNKDLSTVTVAKPIFASTLSREAIQYGGERFPVFREKPVEVLRDELACLASDPEARSNYEDFVNDLVYGPKLSFSEVSQTFFDVASQFLADYDDSVDSNIM